MASLAGGARSRQAGVQHDHQRPDTADHADDGMHRVVIPPGALDSFVTARTVATLIDRAVDRCLPDARPSREAEVDDNAGRNDG